MQSLLHFNPALLGVTQLLTNYFTSIMHFVMLLTLVKRFGQFFVTWVRLSHRGLLHKLSGIGCSDKITSWFSSYLSGWKQRVVLSGHVSEWMSVLAGGPQGSILGPFLFLIYINDIVRNLGCSIRLFADDTSLYIIAHSLNIDLNTISTWAEAWLVAFNTGKTISMLFFTESKPSTAPVITHEQYRTNRNGHTQTARFNTLKYMHLVQSYSSNNHEGLDKT